MLENYKRYLSNSPLFAGLDDVNLNRLVRSMNSYYYNRGDVLIDKHQDVHCIYLITEGSVLIGRKIYEKGSVIATLAFLNSTPFPKVVRVREAATVYKITQASLIKLSEEWPAFARQVTESWVNYVNTMMDEMSEIQNEIRSF